MAGECRDAMPPVALGVYSDFAYLEVDNIDALHDEHGRMREFGIRTVDGHRMMFGERLGP